MLHKSKISQFLLNVHEVQGRNKLLNSGCAQCFRVLQRGQIPDEFYSSPPEHRGCTCTLGTPNSYDPKVANNSKVRGICTKN